MKVLVVSVLAGIVLLVAALEEPQSNYEFLPKDATKFHNSPKTEKRHNNYKGEWSKVITILEEKNVAYITKEQSKHRVRKTVELYTENGSGDMFTTPEQSTEPTGAPEGSGDDYTTKDQSTETSDIPEGSGDGYTTIETSTDIETSTKITITMESSKPTEKCQNGGTFNGETCVCQVDFFGDLCEFITNKITFGPKINYTVNVELKITNVNFSNNLADKTSQEYKEFETRFKAEMKLVYNMSEFRDVNILEVRTQNSTIGRVSDVNGGIIVVHYVIVEIEHTLHNNNTTYETILETLKTQLTTLENNCTSGTNNNTLCIDRCDLVITPVKSTDKELCNSRIPDYYHNYFTPNLTEYGLRCLSDCNPESKNYKDCHGGVCQLIAETGVSCHCPNKDIYFYTSWNCKEKILKNAVYGGVGASIAVLIIIIVVLGIILFRRRRTKSWENLDTIQDNWVSENDFTGDTTLFSINQHDNEGNEDGSSTNNFKPSLEHVNKSTKFKIQRPTICPAN